MHAKTWTNTALFSLLYYMTCVIVLIRSEIAHLPHPTGTYLRGPVNQSVHLGKGVRLQCRVQNRAKYDVPNPDGNEISGNKHLYVQWIIDGFGVTNETLKSVHAERYQMPGPMNEGVYDLVISDVQLEDEATFICQANVKLYRDTASPIMETLTSQPVHLNVVIPPNSLTLRKPVIPSQVSRGYSKVNSNFITIAWNNSTKTRVFLMNSKSSWTRDVPSANNRTFADDPTMIDAPRQISEPTTSHNDSLLNRPPFQQPGFSKQTNGEGDQKESPVIWIKENEQLVLQCETTPSKPVSRIAWYLAGSLIHPTSTSCRTNRQDQNLSPSAMLWVDPSSGNDGPSRFSQLHHGERCEVEEKVITVPTGAEDDSQLTGRDKPTENSLTISTSILRLIVNKSHRRQRVQCQIANSNEFLVEQLPTVSAVIEPLYVDDIRIGPVGTLSTGELREGFNVEYHCTANTNPPNAVYRWVLIPENANSEMSLEDTTRYPDGSKSITIQSVPSVPSSVHLRLQRGMHRSKLACWVGVKSPESSALNTATLQLDQMNEQMIWGKSEHELNILYAAVFDQISDNLRAAKLGQVITLDCSTNANPSAQISLYRVGEAGNQLLSRLSELHPGPNQSFHIQSRRGSTQSNTDLRGELSLSELAFAIKTKGTQVLASTTSKISYPLQIRREEDFGFYIFMARNSDFPPVLGHVFVGEPGPPTIVQCKKLHERSALSMELVCLVHSIPRPKSNQIVWSRRGVQVKSNERLRVHRDQLLKGIRSAITFHNPIAEDFSEYNFTVFNEFGSDWKLLRVSNEASIPMIFIIGSGAATGLAIIFVVVIGCSIRYSRLRSNQPTRMKNNNVKPQSQSNGTEDQENRPGYLRTKDAELYPLANSLAVFSTGSESQQQTCHFCLTAQNPGFVDTKVDMDDMFGSGIAVNGKKSDDSGCELGDVTSIGIGPTDQAFHDQTSTTYHDVQRVADTVFVQNSPTLCYPTQSVQCDTLLSNSSCGYTFINAHTGTRVGTPTCDTCAPQQSAQMQSTQGQRSSIIYDSYHGSSTFTKPLVTKSLSPILVVTPTIPQTSAFDHSTHPTSLIIPQVVFSSTGGLISSPVKGGYFTPPIPSSVPYPLIPTVGDSLLRNAPDIYPDISVLPLNFANDTPGFAVSSSNSNAIAICSSASIGCENHSSTELGSGSSSAKMMSLKISTDDDGTSV